MQETTSLPGALHDAAPAPDERRGTELPHRRILVAVDGSESARVVADHVNRFFGGLEVEILAVNVAPLPVAWVPPSIAFGGMYQWSYNAYAMPERPDTEVDQAVLQAERDGEAVVASSDLIHDDTAVEFGEPADAILRVAEDHGVDMIVVGASNRSMIQRMFDPSVSKALLRNADRPVLVIPTED